MSEVKAEVAELCRLILAYERKVAPLRQQLFYGFPITPKMLWSFMFGSITEISSSHLHIFLHKHGAKPAQKSCDLLLHRLSFKRNKRATSEDLWPVFHPSSIKHAGSILKAREKQGLSPQSVQLPYQSQDQLVSILMETLNYESVAAEMKNNIEGCPEHDQFWLSRIDAEHLQSYLISEAPELRTEHCQQIMRHILANKAPLSKSFYSFFHSPLVFSPDSNPLEEIVLEENLDERGKLTSLFFQNSKSLWNYGGYYKKHNSPLYLK